MGSMAWCQLPAPCSSSAVAWPLPPAHAVLGLHIAGPYLAAQGQIAEHARQSKGQVPCHSRDRLSLPRKEVCQPSTLFNQQPKEGRQPPLKHTAGIRRSCQCPGVQPLSLTSRLIYNRAKTAKAPCLSGGLSRATKALRATSGCLCFVVES